MINDFGLYSFIGDENFLFVFRNIENWFWRVLVSLRKTES